MELSKPAIKFKLNKTRVEALALPAKGQAFYWNWEDVPNGFGVRVTANGARSYVMQKRVDGKTQRVTLGRHGDMTCDQAKVKAAEEIVLVSKGTTSTEEKKRAKKHSVTLREVADAYCLERKSGKAKKPLKERTKQDIQRHIKFNFSDWADKPITKITRSICAARFKEITERSPSQANQAFRVLSGLINYASVAYRGDKDTDPPLFLENPVLILKAKSVWNEEKARISRIPLDRVGAAWNLLQSLRTDPLLPQSADLVIFIMLTGCRLNEATQLTWDRVNLEKGMWFIPDPKNRRAVVLPISKPLRAMLESRPRIEGNPYVFTSRDKKGSLGRANTVMEKVSEVAGDRLTHHDLRRTFNSIARNCGIDFLIIKLLMGHVVPPDAMGKNYTDENDVNLISKQAENIAAWIVEQGAIAAGSNVVQLRGAV